MSMGLSYGVGNEFNIFPFVFKLSSHGFFLFAYDYCWIELKESDKTKVTLLFKSFKNLKVGILNVFNTKTLHFLSFNAFIFYKANETFPLLTFL